MNRSIYRNKIVLFLLVLIVSCVGCGRKKTAYLVFIDYSKSSSTLTVTNRKKVEELIYSRAVGMNNEDLLEVFPIHAYTMSATSVLHLKGPPLEGDLRDKRRRGDWIENIVNAGVQRMWDQNIRNGIRMSTDLYPIVNKILRISKNGYNPTIIIISDMIQDHHGESFMNVFKESRNVVPIKYSKKKVSELGIAGLMKGVNVIIKIPGSPEGDMIYNEIRSSVDAFWEEFYTLCGAEVIIENL